MNDDELIGQTFKDAMAITGYDIFTIRVVDNDWYADYQSDSILITRAMLMYHIHNGTVYRINTDMDFYKDLTKL